MTPYTLWRQRWGRWERALGTRSAPLAQQLAPSLLLDPGVTHVQLRDADGVPMVTWQPDAERVSRVTDPRH